MGKNENEELIKIKRRDKKEKKEKPQKEKKQKKSPPRIKSVPKARGVKLDFTEEAPKYNKYYLSVSKKFRAAKIISAFVLAAFLLFMLVFYRSSITYENLMYLVKDLDTDIAVSMGAYNDISYEQSFNLDFGLFRQRIAVCSNQGFSLYTRAGTLDLLKEESLQSPRLECSEKYALVYDAGGNSYSVYNTLARVLRSKTEFELAGGCVADNGSFALLTKNDESRFLITVYNEDFAEVSKYYKDMLVMDMTIDKSGKYLCAVSADVQSSSVCAQIMISEIGSKESTQLSYSDMMPISASYSDDGRLFVLCDSALLIFEGEKEVAKIDFSGKVPGNFVIKGNLCAISFPENVIGSENVLKVFDTEGSELYNIGISGKITVMDTDEAEALYCVCETKAVRLDLSSGECESVELENKIIDCIAVPGSLIVCSTTGTESLFLEE